MIVKEFCDYTEGLENTLSWWDMFSSTKFFMFVKLFMVFILCSFIMDGLNWLKLEYYIDDIIYVFLFCATFFPVLITGYFQSFRGTLLYSPVRKIFFIKRLAVLASELMPVNAKITVTDRKKRFIAGDIPQLERLLKKRTIFFISGETRSHTGFEASYCMTFTPRGGRIIPGTPVGTGGGGRMYIWEITCATTLQDCEGNLNYKGRKKITVDNTSTAHLSRKSCNNVRKLLEKIEGTGISGHFSISEHELFLTIYDNIKKIRALPYRENFRVKDKFEAVRGLTAIIDILSGKQ